MPVAIDWEGLTVAFENRSQKITHFFDRETGDVVQVLVQDAARHAELAADPRYQALPKDQGERTRGDLEDFAEHCEDEACRRDLTKALEETDAAAAFRRALLAAPQGGVALLPVQGAAGEGTGGRLAEGERDREVAGRATRTG